MSKVSISGVSYTPRQGDVIVCAPSDELRKIHVRSIGRTGLIRTELTGAVHLTDPVPGFEFEELLERPLCTVGDSRRTDFGDLSVLAMPIQGVEHRFDVTIQVPDSFVTVIDDSMPQQRTSRSRRARTIAAIAEAFWATLSLRMEFNNLLTTPTSSDAMKQLMLDEATVFFDWFIDRATESFLESQAAELIYRSWPMSESSAHHVQRRYISTGVIYYNPVILHTIGCAIDGGKAAGERAKGLFRWLTPVHLEIPAWSIEALQQDAWKVHQSRQQAAFRA